MKKDVKKIILNIIPIFLMIFLIKVIKNDYYLLLAYAITILASLKVHYEKNEYKLLIGGIIFMFLAEYIFISTGIETFTSQTLINMPIWLPLLLGYGFIVISRISKELLK
ncbi:hypothetical protein HYT56_04760 [Candidatus Woesearchaeota archaeon]|nr:hypothetical protein [Candidatus Woesearchaeota archaeon]